jgi:hypothetical protein
MEAALRVRDLEISVGLGIFTADIFRSGLW